MRINKKIFLIVILFLFGLYITTRISNYTVSAASLNDEYYSLIATAIDASDTNEFENNKNPQIFDAENEAFINAISARKDIDTYASSIEASSAYEFSKKYAKTFTSELDTSIGIFGVTSDVSGKFDTNANTESYKQKIENYEYYYWFARKYIVNVDWNDNSISDALSVSFKRELERVNSVVAAKQLLRTYGTHVYSTYILGGKLEITKYFTQDATYELSETEKSAAASLNVIVENAKVDAKVSGSVNLSTYESNSSSSSSFYSKLNYHAYGGNVNGAVTASDLFQYKTQFGTGTASGFLYEAWTNSFNNDDVALKIVSAENAVAIWDILDSNIYSTQISFLKKAFNNMCYESYAEKCNELNVSCDYIDSLEYTTKGTLVTIKPYDAKINLPENSVVKINLSKQITDKFDTSEYELKLSSEDSATLNNDILTVKASTKNNDNFNIELLINNLVAYKLNITIKKERFSGGYGTKQQPYLLSTKAELLTIFSDFLTNNNYYQLTRDISLGGEKIDTGGSGTSSPFKGIFDGNGYTISDFTIKASSFNSGFLCLGLFGKNDGIIRNLALDNVVCLTDGLVNINNKDIVLSCGILAGVNTGIISNCQVKNSAIRISAIIDKNSSVLNVGGVVGYSEGLIEYTSFTGGNIYGIATSGKGKINVGGIVGTIAGAKLFESYVYNSNINDYNAGSTTFTMGGIAGCITTRIAEDSSIIKSKLSMCLVNNINNNKRGNTFGYIAGTEKNGEFTACYYTGIKEISVAGSNKSNCIRKNEISLSTLPSSFYDNWIDGPDGPILKTHQKEN